MAEAAAAHFANLLFLQRMRTAMDRDSVSRAFAQHWGTPLPSSRRPSILVSPEAMSIGWANLQRAKTGDTERHALQSTCDALLAPVSVLGGAQG